MAAGHIQGQQCIRHRGDLVPRLEAGAEAGETLVRYTLAARI